jgi:hypothetical protein
MGTADGGLGVDDPVLTEQGAQEGAEGLFVGQGLRFPAKVSWCCWKLFEPMQHCQARSSAAYGDNWRNHMK